LFSIDWSFLICHKNVRWLPDRSHPFCSAVTGAPYVMFKTMLVVITCQACRHHGYAVKSLLPRILLCGGSHNRFEAYKTSVNKRTDRRSMAAHPPRPGFVEQSLLPDDLVQLLWNDQFPFRRSLREGRWPDQ
jgi:hypothetical protein